MHPRLRIECFDRIYDTLSIPSFESNRNETNRNARLHRLVYTKRDMFSFSFDSFRVSIDSNRHNISWPSVAEYYTRDEQEGEGEIGEGRWRRLEVRLCAAIGRRGEDARVKLVSGAKAGGWFSGLTPVYNSRTAPSGWNPPRTFHPEAIHHPLLLTPPPPPRETLTRYQPSPPSFPLSLSLSSPSLLRVRLARLAGGGSLRS